MEVELWENKPKLICSDRYSERIRSVIDGSTDLKPRMSFLAPLDPLMWDKALIQSLWDFTYAWEIYTPAVKRKYGYYTLPILYGDRFVGRIEGPRGRKNCQSCHKRRSTN